MQNLRKEREVKLLPLTQRACEVEDPRSIAYQDLMSFEERIDALQDVVFAVLPIIEALLIVKCYGLGEPMQSLCQIAKIMGAKPDKIKEMRDGALEKLQRDPRSRQWLANYYLN